jgi:hypothetical protein
MDEIPDLARDGAKPVLGKVEPFQLHVLPNGFWDFAQALVVKIK